MPLGRIKVYLPMFCTGERGFYRALRWFGRSLSLTTKIILPLALVLVPLIMLQQTRLLLAIDLGD